jgi:hypothetical protein
MDSIGHLQARIVSIIIIIISSSSSNGLVNEQVVIVAVPAAVYIDSIGHLRRNVSSSDGSASAAAGHTLVACSSNGAASS